MYESNVDRSSLRQGDIIRDFCFPRYSLQDVRLLHSIADEGPSRFADKAIVNATYRYAIVLSQCCEFNEGKRNSFSLGALTPASDAIHPFVGAWGINVAEVIPVLKSAVSRQTLEDLRAANSIDTNAGRNAAINVFLFEDDGSYLKEPFVADFTQVVSVRIKDVNAILRNKILQLNEGTRHKFQKKLGYFYARKAN